MDSSELNQKIIKAIEISVKPLLDNLDERLVLDIEQPIQTIKALIDLLYSNLIRLQTTTDRSTWSQIMLASTQTLYLIRTWITQVPMEIHRNIEMQVDRSAKYQIIDQFTWIKYLTINAKQKTIELSEQLNNLDLLEQHTQSLSYMAAAAWDRLVLETRADAPKFSHKSRSGLWSRPEYQPFVNQKWTNFDQFTTHLNRTARQALWNSQIWAVRNPLGNYSLAFDLKGQFSYYNKGWLFEWFLSYIYTHTDSELDLLLAKQKETFLETIIQPNDWTLALSAGDINLTDEKGKIIRAIQVKNQNRRLLSFHQVILWIGAFKQLFENNSELTEEFFQNNSTYSKLKNTALNENNNLITQTISNLLKELDLQKLK